jgi:hypothetical protein
MGKYERMWMYLLPLFVVVFLLSWFFRYEVSAGGEHSVTLDRWTGKVQRCYLNSCSEWR